MIIIIFIIIVFFIVVVNHSMADLNEYLVIFSFKYDQYFLTVILCFHWRHMYTIPQFHGVSTRPFALIIVQQHRVNLSVGFTYRIQTQNFNLRTIRLFRIRKELIILVERHTVYGF